jgi:hypothetical protein
MRAASDNRKAGPLAFAIRRPVVFRNCVRGQTNLSAAELTGVLRVSIARSRPSFKALVPTRWGVLANGTPRTQAGRHILECALEINILAPPQAVETAYIPPCPTVETAHNSGA